MEKSQEYVEKLRASGLRPTKQRIKICDVLFNRESTFHFSISDLIKQIQNTNEKTISLATVYNTVHAFKKKGYLKEITINEAQSYFDTNTSEHHHFFDENEKKLIDIEDGEIEPIKLVKRIPGKKITSIEVLVRVATDNQNQK